jgi:plasmid stabilization system protein ParE
MPHLVVWLPQAVEDVQNAFRFLASKDERAARAAAEVILKQADILEQFPDAGRPAQDLEPEQRELIVPFGSSGYVLLYEVDGDNVRVLAVRHQREAGY